MDRLVNDRDLDSKRLGRQGQAYVEANYTWEAFDSRARRALSWAAEGLERPSFEPASAAIIAGLTEITVAGGRQN